MSRPTGAQEIDMSEWKIILVWNFADDGIQQNTAWHLQNKLLTGIISWHTVKLIPFYHILCQVSQTQHWKKHTIGYICNLFMHHCE